MRPLATFGEVASRDSSNGPLAVKGDAALRDPRAIAATTPPWGEGRLSSSTGRRLSEEPPPATLQAQLPFELR